MSTLSTEEERRHALKLLADCAESGDACARSGDQGHEAEFDDCVSGCLDCAVICRAAETLLSRGSRFETEILNLAVDVMGTCGTAVARAGSADRYLTSCGELCGRATKELAGVGAG